MKGLPAEQAGLSAVPEKVPISDLAPADSPRIHGERAEHTRMLAEIDTTLPPIVVHRATMRVIDGMHRLRAAALRGDRVVDVVFFTGNDADAFVLAVELNHAHGLPLSTADRKNAATRIVGSHPAWSDRRISAVTGLAASTVASIRTCSAERIGQPDVRVGRDGRSRPVDSAGARRRAGELMLANPAASLREIAKSAGISPSTASDVRARLARGEMPTTPRQCRREGPEPQYDVSRAKPPKPTSEARRDVSPGEFVGLLARDPSLRFNEPGRVLLRFLGCITVDDRQWEEMVRHVPAHQRDIVVQLAKECASAWRGFAERLERHAD